MSKELREAIRNNNPNFGRLIAGGILVDSLFEGKTATMYAIKFNKLKILEDLIMLYKADIDAVDEDGLSLMHYAVKIGLSPIKLLLDLGARLNIADKKGALPIHHAAGQCGSVRILRLLINLRLKGTEYNVKDHNQATLMHYAATLGDTEKMFFLNQQGLSYFDKTANKSDAMHLAAANDALGALNLLHLKGVPFNSKNDEGKTPFDIAVENNSHLAIKFFEKCFDFKNNSTPGKEIPSFYAEVMPKQKNVDDAEKKEEPARKKARLQESLSSTSSPTFISHETLGSSTPSVEYINTIHPPQRVAVQNHQYTMPTLGISFYQAVPMLVPMPILFPIFYNMAMPSHPLFFQGYNPAFNTNMNQPIQSLNTMPNRHASSSSVTVEEERPVIEPKIAKPIPIVIDDSSSSDSDIVVTDEWHDFFNANSRI